MMKERTSSLRAVELVESHAARRALWVIDSAGDRSRLHHAFKQLRMRYLARVKRDRVVESHGVKRKLIESSEKVMACGSVRYAHRTRRGRCRVEVVPQGLLGG